MTEDTKLKLTDEQRRAHEDKLIYMVDKYIWAHDNYDETAWCTMPLLAQDGDA